jgi:glycosyltransferase involved in cell wall biosynthesis
MEAAAFGLPIIVSDLKIFNNGMYFKTGDADDLARVMTCLIEDKTLRESLGQNAKREVEHYDSKKMAELTYKLYESLLW